MSVSGLLEQLKQYSESDYYPFHMPGHKRQAGEEIAGGFENPFSIDITEIYGFDNLHNPSGILHKSMEWAAGVYGADRTYYLVNGSSSGILSAICGTTHNSDTILMSRNSHKSAYHGVFLNHLRVKYIYPQILGKYCVQSGLLSDEICRMLKTYVDIQAVFVVSPTYDGIVSDIKTIANICHTYKIPLIVDEAHGAHFTYGNGFPVSALDLGADVVIQSVHKTLPSYTQTALLHVKEGYVDVEKIERYLHMFQSSSPSYLFLAAIENCIRYMDVQGRQRAERFITRLEKLRGELKELRNLQIMGREIIGEHGVFDLDISKLTISTCGTGLSGVELDRILRERYHLEMEMCAERYVTAITTVMDTEDGFTRLKDALMEIDRELGDNKYGSQKEIEPDMMQKSVSVMPEIAMPVFEALDGATEKVLIIESAGRVSAEYVYVYPPGIPVIVPGEVLQKVIIDMIEYYRSLGMSVQGIKDQTLTMIEVVKENGAWERLL